MALHIEGRRGPERAYVGLGSNLDSNLGNPPATLRAAANALEELDGTRLLRRSSVFRSAPLGYAAQPDFYNAVAALDTFLSPLELLHALQEIERRFGRVRSFPNAPRILDLDLLLYGERVEGNAELQLPHPRMRARAFVLAPLAELAPELVIPGEGPVRSLLAALADQRVERVEQL